ncbi:sigma-54-dependent transcriptional regulator [Altererythrobacter sp. MTPC7]|uniref:sigma-54-dependent transcriptional regulator n=1 Tax=Altererythrobacter sp. MTPC7 TaxID=3056567 RepID=UPI0036F36B53
MSAPKDILVVEDDPAIATVIVSALESDGYSVTHCTGIADRDALLAKRSYAAMLTDVMLEDGDGIAALDTVRSLAPSMPFIVLSAQNTLDTAVRASENEAFEYFPKPFDLDELLRAVRQAAGQGASAVADDAAGDGMPLVGRSQAMQAVFRMIARVLRNDLTVLVTGESGTGKELVAEAIHQLGHRKTGPFVAVNAAAIPHDLIESELFGHEKGAFTGATAQAIGKFEQANGGTLFLDEIGDMPVEAQTRLLRALQSGRIRRVGGRQDVAVDVRIVTATNRDLGPMIAAGTFREDLYYRLAVVPIELPPLRERREDIGMLANHFLAQAVEEGLPRRGLSEKAIDRLSRLEWRGNVRELRNLVFRLAIMAREDVITDELVEEITSRESAARPAARNEEQGLSAAIAEWLERTNPPSGALHRKAQAAFEKPLFEEVLRRTGGNQLRAAAMLGINRNTLRKRLSDLSIDAELFTTRA